jgi:site-specific DNA recombinase
MIFPDTHEAIIDQDTWDIARKMRSKKKPESRQRHLLPPPVRLVYCADCGARMGFISPEANHSENTMIQIPLFNAATIGVRPLNVSPTL